jgi:hypothetical protein
MIHAERPGDMLKRSVVGLMVLVGMMMVGCGTQPGTTTMTYSRGKTPPPLTAVNEAGEFRLYPSNSATPTYTANLKAGDEYGFVTKGEGDNERVYGYAAGKEIPLEGWLTTSYYWKRQK